MSIRIVFPFVCSALACLGLTPTVSAQGDPIREIQEIARAVDEQLQEIDRLLLESGKKSQPRQKPKELLQQAHERSQTVEDGIDSLIEKLQQMKNQGSSSSSGSPDQQNQDQQSQDQNQGGQPKSQGQGQGQRNRNENKTPEIAPRPGQEPGGEQPQGGQPGGEQPQGQGQQPQPGEGQPQPQPSGNGNPLGGEEQKDGGKNTTGNRQPEPETGPGNPGTGEGSWGELQPYMNFLKNRGSPPPQVPEKFRKYYEAWLKQNPPSTGQGTGSKPGGTRR